MKQAAVFRRVVRLLRKFGSPVAWTRRSLSLGGAAGTVTETAPPVVATVQAAQIEEWSNDAPAPTWWASATLRVIVGAQSLPFDPEATMGDSPAVHFTDTVSWGGREYRVLGSRAWWAPGQTTAPKPYAYFVGLGA